MIDKILEKLNLFADIEFKFDPKFHKYTYKGEKFISVTQLISRFHEKFDTDYWSSFKSNETGIPKEEIELSWKLINERSNEIGTATHNWIENYFKKLYQPLPTDLDVIDRINKFNIAYSKYLYKLTPVAFEVRIFSRKWKIAGMIDSIFLYKDKIIIIDYKTNKEFTSDEHYKGVYKKLLYPFEEYYENHLNEYSIQVSLYRLILRECGIDVSNCYMLHIGPNGDAKMHTAKDFTSILEKYLNDINKIEL